ncbi:CPBP family intramembrane metalloprotease [Halobacillus litoralis]|uniref:CPBP family intramembrane glutamic endopeptidase n=1 Tax=Halobacillus litoralis TaxID=45668 RepID=UPI001CD2A83E|nr:type II CAAX endopeptidase family protein [Halobacillus litoralis]MCA0972477.1 CPBP family intramembrane metalloprotease [Halobacillus litoralis]
MKLGKAKFGVVTLLVALSIYTVLKLLFDDVFSIETKFYPYREYQNIAIFFLFMLSMLLFRSFREHIRTYTNLHVLKAPGMYAWVALGFVLLYVAQYVSFTFGIFVDPVEVFHYQNNLYALSTSSFVIIAATGIFVPVTEEVVFRSLLYHWLHSKLGFYAALILQSLIFSLLHPNYPLLGMLMGVLMALLYTRYQSFLPPLILHAAWNTWIMI